MSREGTGTHFLPAAMGGQRVNHYSNHASGVEVARYFAKSVANRIIASPLPLSLAFDLPPLTLYVIQTATCRLTERREDKILVAGISY